MTPRCALAAALTAALTSACAAPAASTAPDPDLAARQAALARRASAARAASAALTAAAARADARAQALLTDRASGAGAAALGAALEKTRWRIGSAWTGTVKTGDYAAVLRAYANPTGSLSMGSTSSGHLLGAVELELDGPHHAIVSRARPRATHFATRHMIDVVRDVARSVHDAFPGSKLAVGNMSLRRGGDIRWSVSHNSGRDADLAFYALGPDGKPLAVAPDLVSFGDDGYARDGSGLRFDVPRNWALAKALLTHPKAQIQYLFVSTALKQRLLDHATRLGEPEWLLERARGVLHQPTDSSPHDDHFHLRLTCALEERLLGCVDIGPRWSWVDWHEDALLARVLTMRQALSDPDPGVRVAALEYLGAIRAPLAPDLALAAAVYDPDPAVRDAATRTAASAWSHTGAAIALAQRALTAADLDSAQRARLWAMLRRSRDPWVVPFARDRILADGADELERARAARALSHHMRPDLVPFLLARLEADPSGAARADAAKVLRRIANRAEEVDWATDGAAARARALSRWRSWWEANRAEPRDVWLASGFGALGIPPSEVATPDAVGPMIDALGTAPDHLVYNINRTLREVTGKWSSLEATDGRKLQKKWTRWWKKNRARFLARS